MPNIYPWWGGPHQYGQCPHACFSDEPQECLTAHLRPPVPGCHGPDLQGAFLGWGV